MPELPEVEHLRRSLEPVLLGRVIARVRLRRRDVARLDGQLRQGGTRARLSRGLLSGAVITRLERHGKQLAVVADDQRCLCIHLGMSGQLRFVPTGQTLRQENHLHCVWDVQSTGQAAERGRLIFRDPRRFGGLWSYRNETELNAARWRDLGPDALQLTVAHLAAACTHTMRPIKSVLLDQSVVAGVGNIYADESLHAAGIHPGAIASHLREESLRRLLRDLRRILKHAIDAGGSSVRDYRDGRGNAGAFASRHLVYGRKGQPCRRCGDTLASVMLNQRSTVFCPRCQRRPSND